MGAAAVGAGPEICAKPVNSVRIGVVSDRGERMKLVIIKRLRGRSLLLVKDF